MKNKMNNRELMENFTKKLSSKTINEATTKHKHSDIEKMNVELSKKWKQMLDKQFLGKTITATASSPMAGNHKFETQTITKIKEVDHGSSFGTHISVKDENGVWYILKKD